MSWMDAALGRRRLVLATVVLLSLLGALAWFDMNRQEDPEPRTSFRPMLSRRSSTTARWTPTGSYWH
ncbi:MAG: hypothetical protein LC637_09165 [Xanthomonadaceae bacterium]|nr:hypothetical protein [Xanthomonadaceae bacterium]